MTSLLLALAVAVASPAEEPSVTPTPVAAAPIHILVSKPDPEPAPRGSSLAEVAKHIKLKLPANQPRVLTNATVKQLAEGVELTTGTAGPGGPQHGGAAFASSGGNEEARKTKWQQRYRAAVERVRRLEADVKSLEAKVVGLERDFYSRDDPVYRDSTIKPAWDKALSDLENARTELEAARSQPDEVVNAARREGALPGWFRGLDDAAPPPASAPQTQQGRPAPRPTPRPTRVQGRSAGPPT